MNIENSLPLLDLENPPHDEQPQRSDSPSSFRAICEFSFGVLLPFITFLLEYSSGMCADLFFDPMPTWWHGVLVLAVPVINFYLFIGLGKTQRNPAIALWLNGIGMGITLCYALVFVPIMPLAVMGILAYGLGFLPLSPFLALLATWSMRSRIKSVSNVHSRIPLLFPALGIAVAMMVLPEVPYAMTRRALHAAVHSDVQADRSSAVASLRRWGRQDTVLRYCYPQISGNRLGGGLFDEASASPMRLANLIPCDVTETEARAVYFRMTGASWNDQPRPDLNQRGWIGFDSDTDLDLGGETVAGKVKNLSLQSSRMDVSVDPQSLVTYSEWTLLFQNDNVLDQEARAQIQLPPGGVVSRLTLWINGEPREAAFGGSGTVRKAYQEVAVVQRRDPVLVTYAGIDRILMQCFPVPIGGQMKVRIGFTSPLVPTINGTSQVALPRFNEVNFQDPDNHSVFVTGSKVIGDGFKNVGKGMQGTIAFNGAWGTDLTVKTAGRTSAISVDDPVNSKIEITQSVDQVDVEPKPFVVLIDGSIGLRPYYRDVAEALTSARPKPAGVIVVGEQIVEIPAVDTMDVEELLSAIQTASNEGGCDNLPGLINAWDVAEDLSDASNPTKDLVWFHGPQPVNLGNAEELAQRFEYAKLGFTLHCVSFESAPNRIVESLPASANLRLHRLPSAETAELLKQLFGSGTEFVLRRTAKEKSKEKAMKDNNDAVATEGSSHITRLWANDEVNRMMDESQGRKRDDAIAMAVSHQIVSRVSGAVVLEQQSQYDAAGLKPVDPATVPTIPEPETWMMLILGFVLISMVAIHRRRRRHDVSAGV